MLTEQQVAVLERADVGLPLLDLPRLEALVAGSLEPSVLDDGQLVEFLQAVNALYRAGLPLISDAAYDHQFLAELVRRNPSHDYLHQVEPEPAFTGKTVALPERMLSTDKAYHPEAIQAWIRRVTKAASELGIDEADLRVRMTPKLDGYAAFDDGERLYTRGNGIRGTDITRVLGKGLTVGGNGQRGQGPGEIVVARTWFAEHLADQFDNARNFQAAILAEKKEDPRVDATLESGAALFMPFAQLPYREVLLPEVMGQFDAALADLWAAVDYDVDGVILELTDDSLKAYMGATTHHHRWQIAFKVNADSAEVEVLAVTPQTSRSGRVNPVVELSPTRLSGATISRATAHHYGMVRSEGIGPGARIELVRSGLVIPKIERVLSATEPAIPDCCPSCGQPLVWDSDYLYCVNHGQCPAQLEHTIEHFFRTLGNVDGFGAKTIQKLRGRGVETVPAIYQLRMEQLVEWEFGEKTAANLIAQLYRSRTEAIEDWRFLAAFGVLRLGKGNCERLLRHCPLEDVFALNEGQVAEFEGFAEITARAIVAGLLAVRGDVDYLLSLGFNLLRTPLFSEAASAGQLLAGKIVVFTGTMESGTRGDMEAQARSLGAVVGKSVSGKTDYLVAGSKVGQAKLGSAADKGVVVLSESEYQALVDSGPV